MRGDHPLKDILRPAHRDVLQQYAWSNMLLAFDYDGTLAPIVPDPAKAAMRHTTRRLLTEVALRYPCIVVSGRAQSDARRWMRGIPLRQVIGNHGVEPWQATPPLMAQVKRWTPRLTRRLTGFKGVWIEDKNYSLAVHYRRSREKKKARAAILEAAAELGPARLIGGRQVINILPEGAPHKGMALLCERDRQACDTALYLGDDVTDEDVFGLDQPGRLLTIRVGSKGTSLASYCLRGQAAVDELLEALLDLRPHTALTRAAQR